MRVTQSLARGGITVCATIHCPPPHTFALQAMDQSPMSEEATIWRSHHGLLCNVRWLWWQVMRVTQSLARGGITVCATIHCPPPHTFALFDRLLVLQRGRVVYFGSNGVAASAYFTGLPNKASDGAWSVWVGCMSKLALAKLLIFRQSMHGSDLLRNSFLMHCKWGSIDVKRGESSGFGANECLKHLVAG